MVRRSRRPRPTRRRRRSRRTRPRRPRRASSSRRTSPQSRSRKKREQTKPGDIRTPDGAPTRANPTLTLGLPGPAPVGVPNFVISKFRIPPFLLPIYQAAGTQYGIRWEVLAAINEIETDYGRNLNVSSAGALGWMQFIPSSWRAYGTDANRDGEKDPYNPVDAIFAAARYLKAAGAEDDLRRAIFAYNHADWYVDSVMMRARLISGLPADLVGSLTGLTQGHFPVHAQRPLRGRPRRARPAPARPQGPPRAQRRQDRRLERPPPLDQHLHAARRAGDRRQRRRGAQDRQEPQARSLHRAAGRVREPLHLRAPRQGLEALPGPEDLRRPARPRTSSATRVSRGEEDLPKPTAPASAGTQARPATIVTASAYRQARRQLGHRHAAAGPRHREGAPVRQPDASGEPRGRRGDRAAARPGRLRGVQGLLLQDAAAEALGGQAEDPQEGVEGHRRHRPRSRRQGQDRPGLEARPAPQLLDPARRPRRAADRPQADPRRLEAARGERDLPRRGPQPVRDQPGRRPGAADVEGGPHPPGAGQPGHRPLRLRPRRHPLRAGRPPRARDARVPGRVGPAADGHLAEVRPRLTSPRAGTSRTTAPATRSTSRRSTAPRSWATRARARSPRPRSGSS